MPPSTVLIISDEPDFAGALTRRWQRERQVPRFTIFGFNPDQCEHLSQFDIAIVGPGGSCDKSLRDQLLQGLGTARTSAILVEAPPQNGEWNQSIPTILRMPRTEGWVEAVIAVGSVLLDRCEIESRLLELEEIGNAASAQATLGRFMLEMRHTIANSLTTVLGNAELLLSEPAILSTAARFQLETIRNMGLRMNEIMQRFSSLHAELRVVEQHEESSRARAASQA